MPIEALDPPAADAPPKKRGPGRPKGSKNKPKDPVDEFVKQTRKNGDDAPGGEKKTRRKRISKKVTEDIEQALAEILCAPAMAAALMDDEWAAQHFVVNGKELAHRLAVVSERNDQLRRWCENLLQGESVFVVGMAAAAYIIPALLHFNIIPGPDGMLGVPRRPRRRGKKAQRMTGSPTDGTDWRDSGITDQERYEAERRQAEMEAEEAIRVDEEEISYGGEDGGPPVFTE